MYRFRSLEFTVEYTYKKKQYLLQQPKKLEHLAIIKTGDWIALQAEIGATCISELFQLDVQKAEVLLSQHIDIIRNCLVANVPKIHYDAVASEGIRALKTTISTKPVGQQNVIKRMIEILFTKNLTSLVLHHDTFTMFKDSLCSKSYMLTDLVDLKIKIGIAESTAIGIIKELHNLKYLRIRFSTDNILLCIADNCELIEDLDLYPGTQHLNYNSLNILSRLRNLKRLILKGISLAPRGVSRLLLSCKNIEHIDEGVNNILRLGFRIIAKENAETRLALKTYYSVSITLEDIQLVAQLCPHLEYIKLDSYNHRVTNLRMHLLTLTRFPNLRELELGRVGFHEQLKDVLQVIGCNLMHLLLERVHDVDLNALMDISQMCPNLQSLSLNIIYPIVNTALFTRKFEIPPFRSLNTIRLYYLTQFQEHMTQSQNLDCDEHILFLLSNSLNIEFIDIFGSIQLTEDVMSNVLETNSFNCLKLLRINPNNMTPVKVFVNQLVKTSFNEPEVIILNYKD